MRVLRSVLLVLFVILVLFPVAAYCVVYFVANSPVGQEALASRLGRALPNASLNFAGAELGTRPLDLHLHDVTLASPGGAPVVSASSVGLLVDTPTLLSGTRRVDRLAVEGFAVTLSWDRAGKLEQAGIFKGSAKLTPSEESHRGASGGELRDVLLSNGALRLSGPSWSVHLSIRRCEGRLSGGEHREIDLGCEWSGGTVTLAPPLVPASIELTLGESAVRELRVEDAGRRVVLNGLRVALDGHTLRGDLVLIRGGSSPHIRFAIRGRLAPSVARLLSAGRVDGAVIMEAEPGATRDQHAHEGLRGEADAQHVKLTLGDLRVDGRVRFDTGDVTGLHVQNVSVDGADRLLTVYGDLSVDTISRQDAKEPVIRGLTVQATAELETSGERIGDRIVAALRGLPRDEANDGLFKAIQVNIQSAQADQITTPEAEVEGAHVKTATLIGKSLLQWTLSAVLDAKHARVRGVPLRSPSIATRVRLDGFHAKVEELTFTSADTGRVAATGDVWASPGLTMRWRTKLGLVFEKVPTAPFMALVVPLEAAHDKLPALLRATLNQTPLLHDILTQGTLDGELSIEGDPSQPNAVKIVPTDIRLVHTNDTVTIEAAPSDLSTESEAFFELDAHAKRFRVGATTFSYRVIRNRKRAKR